MPTLSELVRSHTDLDESVSFNSLDGVDYQVHQGLGQTDWIGLQIRQPILDLRDDFDLPRCGFRPEQFANMIDNSAELDRFEVQGRGTG